MVSGFKRSFDDSVEDGLPDDEEHAEDILSDELSGEETLNEEELSGDETLIDDEPGDETLVVKESFLEFFVEDDDIGEIIFAVAEFRAIRRCVSEFGDGSILCIVVGGAIILCGGSITILCGNSFC